MFDLFIFYSRESLNPVVLTDLSHNGTYVNGQLIGKGNCRILDDSDAISITHPHVKGIKFYVNTLFIELNI